MAGHEKNYITFIPWNKDLQLGGTGDFWRNFKWPSIYKVACPIRNGTIKLSNNEEDIAVFYPKNV